MDFYQSFPAKLLVAQVHDGLVRVGLEVRDHAEALADPSHVSGVESARPAEDRMIGQRALQVGSVPGLARLCLAIASLMEVLSSASLTSSVIWILPVVTRIVIVLFRFLKRAKAIVSVASTSTPRTAPRIKPRLNLDRGLARLFPGFTSAKTGAIQQERIRQEL